MSKQSTTWIHSNSEQMALGTKEQRSYDAKNATRKAKNAERMRLTRAMKSGK
jgi:hypothetical protein